MSVLGQGLKFSLRQAQVFNLKAHGKAKTTRAPRPDRHLTAHLRSARILALLAGDLVQRPAKTRRVAGSKKMFWRHLARLLRPAHRLGHRQFRPQGVI